MQGITENSLDAWGQAISKTTEFTTFMSDIKAVITDRSTLWDLFKTQIPKMIIAVAAKFFGPGAIVGIYNMAKALFQLAGSVKDVFDAFEQVIKEAVSPDGSLGKIRDRFTLMFEKATLLALQFINQVVKTFSSVDVEKTVRSFVDKAIKAASAPMNSLIDAIASSAKKALKIAPTDSASGILPPRKAADGQNISVYVDQQGKVMVKWGGDQAFNIEELDEYAADRQIQQKDSPALSDAKISDIKSDAGNIKGVTAAKPTPSQIKKRVDDFDKLESEAQALVDGISKCCKRRAHGCLTAGTLVHGADQTRPIEKWILGQRALTFTDDERNVIAIPVANPDVMQLRHLKLAFAQEDGGRCDIDLLRSVDWIEAREAKVDGFVYLEIAELGIRGPAAVLAIEPCPPIEDGTGRLVIGTFRHTARDIYNLTISSECEPIGVTKNHPFWSVDRTAWVSVSELAIGESLRTLDGIGIVEAIEPRSFAESVYNIEVDADNVYRIGQTGVLAHNASEPQVVYHYSACFLSSVLKLSYVTDTEIFQLVNGTEEEIEAAISSQWGNAISIGNIRDVKKDRKKICQYSFKNPGLSWVDGLVNGVYKQWQTCNTVNKDKFTSIELRIPKDYYDR